MMTTLNCDEIRRTLFNGTDNGLNNSLHGGMTVLDVCTALEYDEGALPNAQHIPLSVLPALADERLDRDTPIVVYSRSEGRAIIAEKILNGLGFTDVTNIGDMRHCQQQDHSHNQYYH